MPSIASAIASDENDLLEGGPSVGVIVVWGHHVGKIVGHENGQWIIQSGNDGRAVRTRPRSIAGAIAFRRA